MTNGIAPPVLSLEGRTALVTGGGTGLGKACATALAAAGASVTICGPDAAVLDAACAALAAMNLHDVTAITADVTDESQVATAVHAAAADGVLHIAVANAGVALPGSLLHIGAEHWMGPIGVNVLGTAHTIKHAALAMKEGGGSIITISSIASQRPAAFMNTYSVSKAAVDELTRAAAAELGRFGIRVNGIRPGWMRTETVEATTDEKNLAMIKRQTPLAADTPLGQLGDPDDVARAVVYLASDYSGWITGQLLSVCGGSSLPPPAGDFSRLARMIFPEDMARDFGPSEEQ
jgi:NAD(P)-dependent dehydrogenase (short-subunit alcohol dehydrogenase family)